MHDLRPSPSRTYQLAIGGDRSREVELLGPSSAGDVSYFRRAPRSNELFFVYDQATVKPIVEAFLAALADARDPLITFASASWRGRYWPIAFENAAHGTGAPCTGAIVATSNFIRRTWLKKLRIAGVGAAGGASCVSNRSASNAIRSAGR